MSDLLPYLKLYRRHWGALSVGMLLALATLLFSLGLLALSGWFITATALAGLTVVTAQTFDFFSPGAGVRGFSIGRTAARYFERLVSHDATFKLLAWLRSWFFEKLLPLSMTQLKRYRKAELLNRLVADVDALDQLYLRLFSPVTAAVLVVILLSLGLSFFSPVLGRGAILLMGVWLIVLPLMFYRLGYKSGRQQGKLMGELRQKVLDYLQGMAESRIYGSEVRMRERTDATEQHLHHTQKKMSRLEGLGGALMLAGAGISAVIMLYLAAGEYQQGVISGPVMVMSVFAVLAAFEALMPLPGAFQFLGNTQLAASRLTEILEEEAIEFGDKTLPDAFKGQIAFLDVYFQYPAAAVSKTEGPMILDGISLDIPAGQHLALLGKTGCGKSTLIRILTRQLTGFEGRIEVGGIAINDYSEASLYQLLTVIPQQTHVFSSTLRQNLKMARPEAQDSELLETVKAVGLDRLAAAEGDHNLLDLWLGQGGVALSGGEQRRLAIARALLKKGEVLIMDEASEGLDPISEDHLMNQILDAYRDKTVIMITHKKAMLERMDRVIQMDGGRVV
ncbi:MULTISPECIES: cysteine/glutathione ABC transporter ATP-binding protein/permease CydC [unclassified Endozoicomonas]|uniref:heme ABC transporter ATP-binding protein/permease CydC n=1 Tax=unclassified Endozoicomonas TaxID=2644528 RepID=UPI0021496E15|nr:MULTISPECIES: cysteine/glutathione ABC transporter ATP-binding protein/permease CydC [unclassified Endozoicomonas]